MTNRRQWRDFMSAVHGSLNFPVTTTYPKLINALRAGRAKVNDQAARAATPALPQSM